MCDKTEREPQGNVYFESTPASENDEHQCGVVQSLVMLGATTSETDRAWANALDDKLTEEDVKQYSSEGASKQIVVDHTLYTRPGLTTQLQQELVGDAFVLDQSMVNVFERSSGHVSRREAANAPSVLAEDLELVIDVGTDKEMTYTSLTTVPQRQQDQLKTHDAASTFTAAAATAEVQMHPAEFDTVCYRFPSTSVYLTPPPHVLPQQPAFLVHPRGTWTPFSGSANPPFPTRTFTGNKGSVQGYVTPLLPPPVPSTSGGSDGSVTPNTSSGGADGVRQVALAGGDLSSSADCGRPGVLASSDLMNVAPLGNMGQLQHRVRPLVNVPYHMPFNGRENHNEKERKRRSRIKNACQNLRSIVPGLSEKTDKATVFEFTVKYVLHIRRCLGARHDRSMSQDFMQKYSPY